jgi:DNA-directed RNA polymerase subunit RPC12/RpoP
MMPDQDILYQSYSVPLEVRNDLKTVIERADKVIIAQSSDIDYMFKVWNRYLTDKTNQEDRACARCASKIFFKLRRIVMLWNQYGIDNDQRNEQQI